MKQIHSQVINVRYYPWPGEVQMHLTLYTPSEKGKNTFQSQDPINKFSEVLITIFYVHFSVDSLWTTNISMDAEISVSSNNYVHTERVIITFHPRKGKASVKKLCSMCCHHM